MKRIITIGLILVITTLFYSLSAQNVPNKSILPGSWMGKISLGGTNIRMVFNIKINEKDSLTATLDSPDQGAINIPLGRVFLIDQKLTIQAPLISGKYEGTIINDTTINGTWTQGGSSFPVNIIKLKTSFALNRPQEPKPKFPYISEDVTFTNVKANIKLAGTLTLPEGDGPFTAAILITGSGGQNRNEELQGHKPFLVISDWLTRQGIAVLRYDDRGIAKSQGSQLDATSADFATDAEAAFLFLRSNPKINPGGIGFIGHSEGGLIAPIVASSNRETAFIVSLAGPGISGIRIITRQAQDINRSSGVPEDQIKAATEINSKLFEVLKKEKDNKKAEEKIIAVYKEILEKEKTPEDEAEKALNQIKSSLNPLSYNWYRYFLYTDPAIFWKKVKCPVLALNGDKDLQVSADENLPAIEKAVRSSGNSSVKTVRLPGLNHLFQQCNKGLPAEYGEIEQTFSPEALQIISDWILALKISR